MLQGRVRIVGSVLAGSGGISVQLESDNPDVASVPERVVIEARESTSNPFTVTHRAVATPTPVTITATLATEGDAPQEWSVILTVQPPRVSGVTVAQPTVVGKTASVQGTVTLNGPAPGASGPPASAAAGGGETPGPLPEEGGIIVFLSSTNPSKFRRA